MLPWMGTRERPSDRGRRRAIDALRRLGNDHRLARTGAGLSLRDAGAASGAPHQQLLRFERGELDRISIPDLGAWCAVVGLDLALRSYPAGDPLRDRAHLALLERLRTRLHPSLRWKTEAPLPIPGDLRAWDALIRGGEWRLPVEAETVLGDLQATERKLTLKLRDSGADHVILLVADTTPNRRALGAAPGAFANLPLGTREMLRALSRGDDPGGSGIVIL
jgi:hypothetical protein